MGIEALLKEDLDPSELGKVVFMHSYYKEGHPFCYNIYGEFRNNEFDDKAFGNEEKRWRFASGGSSTWRKGLGVRPRWRK